MNKIIDTLFHYILSALVLGYIFYEELVWERFAQPIFRYIQSFELLKKLEVYLHDVHGNVILVVFLILFGVTELLGIYAGILLLEGKVFTWAVMYVSKVPIAAFTFWLFRVTKLKLLAFAWFKKSYDYVMSAIDWVKASETYINIKTKAVGMKQYLRKNYLREGDSTKQRVKKIYRRLKIRIKEVLKK